MNDLCQRWQHGQHSWRHRSDGGFDRARYEVAPITVDVAEPFVLAHHYSGSFPSDKASYGLYLGDRLVGVAVLSVPTNTRALTNVFPDLVPFYESIELGRFVLLDEVPANGESFFLGQVFRLAGSQGFRGVLSMSDPLPRRNAAGRLVIPGHVGLIYQATNARYIGRSTAGTIYVLPDGTVFNRRTAQKVRSQERGHVYAERILEDLGARPMATAQAPAAWLAQALDDVGARRVRHRGNHRFAFALGTPAERRRVIIALEHRPYPKTTDQEAAA